MTKIKIPEHDSLDEGLYPAILVSVEPMDSDRGEYLRWKFIVPVDDGKEISRIANSSTSFGAKSKGRKWLAAAMGRDLEPGETIDFDAVLPARCRIVIKKSDDGYDRVDDVLRAERRPQTPSRQPAAVPVADSPEMDTLMQRIDATSEPDDDIPL